MKGVLWLLLPCRFLPKLLNTWVYRIPRFKQWRKLWFDLIM